MSKIYKINDNFIQSLHITCHDVENVTLYMSVTNTVFFYILIFIIIQGVYYLKGRPLR